MEFITGLLSALGLAGSAGLNAWIPLFLVGLADRFLPDRWFHLPAGLDFLSTPIGLAVTGFLLLVETFADKIPVVDHLNDAVQTFVRPAAGALLFLAGVGAIPQLPPAVALILGFLTAGAVHTLKAGFRPLVTATTGGAGNFIVSLVEDFVAFVATVMALLAPLLIVFLLLAVTWLVVRGRARGTRMQAGSGVE